MGLIVTADVGEKGISGCLFNVFGAGVAHVIMRLGVDGAFGYELCDGGS